ncbi:MAG: Na+/H+ antiporter subunit C [Betaproteobacteria bacterium]|nr:Na+/H+ antiporter subunit C [Betaproteobacteria bacterium]
MNELIVALAIGVLTASGTWLLLRPRTFQVVIGLSLLSYAVNLFILAMGRLKVDAAPIVAAGVVPDPAAFTDPLPQALVLTAIVISFAMTSLLLVVLLAARGLTGTDHVDGKMDEDQADEDQADEDQADKNQADKNQADKNQADAEVP